MVCFRRILLWGGVLLLVCPSLSWAYTFKPSELEFRAWPAFCKVVYLRTNIGKTSPHYKHVVPSDHAKAGAVLGDWPYGEGGVHHLCAGMTLLDRARAGFDPIWKRRYLDEAESQTLFTMDKSKPGGISFTLSASQMALVLYEKGEVREALDLLDWAIQQSPSTARFYVVKATLHYRRGEYELSRDVLVLGTQRIEVPSPEIQYNLGLVLIKIGDYESAAEHAYIAYENGHPLPGLRSKLEKLGHWSPDN